jgi:hypothetical protein
MAPFAPPKDEALIAGYEELRRQALIGHAGAGLAVFIRRGMREWMHASSGWASPLPAAAFAHTEAKSVIPQNLQMEIILILAGMLLHGFQEACK